MTTRRVDAMAREFMRYKQVTGTKLLHLTIAMETYEAKLARARMRIWWMTISAFVVGLLIGVAFTAYVMGGK